MTVSVDALSKFPSSVRVIVGIFVSGSNCCRLRLKDCMIGMFELARPLLLFPSDVADRLLVASLCDIIYCVPVKGNSATQERDIFCRRVSTRWPCSRLEQIFFHNSSFYQYQHFHLTSDIIAGCHISK